MLRLQGENRKKRKRFWMRPGGISASGHGRLHERIDATAASGRGKRKVGHGVRAGRGVQCRRKVGQNKEISEKLQQMTLREGRPRVEICRKLDFSAKRKKSPIKMTFEKHISWTFLKEE